MTGPVQTMDIPERAAGDQMPVRGTKESAWLAGWEAGYSAASAETICAVLERELVEMDGGTWAEKRERAIALLRRERSVIEELAVRPRTGSRTRRRHLARCKRLRRPRR
jgi:hypothetical protein